MATRNNRDHHKKGTPKQGNGGAESARRNRNDPDGDRRKADAAPDAAASSETIPFSRSLIDDAIDLFKDRKFHNCTLLAEEAYKLVRGSDSHALFGEICLLLAKAGVARGDITSSTRYLHEGLSAYARSENRDAEADAYLESAPIFVAAHRIDDARTYLERGLNLALAIGENNVRIFKYYQFLSLVNLQEGMWRDALRCAERAQVSASRLESPRFRCISLLTVARVYMVRRKYRTAHAYLDKALPLSLAENFFYEMILNHSYRASMAVERGDYTAAEAYFRKVSHLLGDTRGKKEAAWNLALKSAELDLLRSEKENARSRIESVIGEIRAAGYRHFDVDLTRLDARLREADGDIEGAISVIDGTLTAFTGSPPPFRHLPLLAIKAGLLADSDRFRARTILFRVEEAYKKLKLNFQAAETLVEQAGLAALETPDSALHLLENARNTWKRFARDGEIEKDELERLMERCDSIEEEAARAKQKRIRQVAAILTRFGRTDAPIREILADAAAVFLREAEADRFFVAFKKPGEGWCVELAVRVGGDEAQMLVEELAGSGSLKQPSSGEELLVSGKHVFDSHLDPPPKHGKDENIETGFYWIFPLLEGIEVIGYLFFSRTGANIRTAAATPVEGIYPVFVYWVAALLRMEMQRMKHLDDAARPCGLSRFVGREAGIEKMKKAVRIIASSPLSVLVTGESGTGRKLLAQAIHEESPRAAFPMISVDCGSMGPMAVEQLIFGFGRGAHPSAPEGKAGLFELADHGTVFFDEIGNLPPGIQVKLHRVIEEREIRRIGEVKPRKVDIRIITATSLNPEEAIRNGSLDAGLYYRLKQFVLLLPPLRERTGDILVLAEHFLDHYSREFGVEKMTLSPAALERLTDYPWPGNVRELKNCLYHAQILSDGKKQLETGDLPLQEPFPTPAPSAEGGKIGISSLDKAIADFEKDHVAEVLAACGENRKTAAARLGISIRSLYHKIKKYDLSAR